MVVDTSSLVCIILCEPEAALHARALAGQASNVISAANWFESMMVVRSRRGETGTRELGQLLRALLKPV